ncbi:MAG: hypothetical protein QM662_11935 [Gordonia sp. (in: high G+C Gram-positive bacteria)]
MAQCGVVTAVSAVVVLTAGACTVTGEPVAGSADLSARSVTADDFPIPGATQVPAQAVPFALRGLAAADPAPTRPAECVPSVPDADGAVLWQVTGEESIAYTTGVVVATGDLAAVTDQAQRCAVAYGDGPAGTEIRTRVEPPPPAASGVENAAVRRAFRTGGGNTITSTLTLIAQRDGVRVYVQYRWLGDTDLPADAGLALDGLFQKAVAAAFG